VVAWARQAAHGRGSASHGLALANALVARVGRDGVAHQSTLFASQRGESPAWKLGPAEWDVVEERRLQSGGVEQDMTWAHPSTGETLVVAFPASALDASLRLTYGLADSGLQFRAGAPVDVAVFVDGARLFDVTCPNTSGWKRAWMDTAAYAGRQADVVLLIRTASDVSRHFAFRLDLSSQPARGVDNQPVAGPVPLVGGRTLRDGIDHLRVYRLDGDTRSDATSDGRTLSAADMHEADGAGGAGSVFRRWALGTPPWDAVGLTRQVSAGVARDGLWAHPRRGTRLVLEGSVTTGELLRGFFGFTDYAAMQANGLKITAPVHLAVSVDGHLLVDQEAPRAAGWRDVEVTLGPSTAPHRLRVEISADVDSWGHFVFDLWSS
jgi:hypothetical protein